jgi:hypothetical protein
MGAFIRDDVTAETMPHDDRSTAILARSIYRTLRARGFSTGELLTIACEIMGWVTRELSESQDR